MWSTLKTRLCSVWRMGISLPWRRNRSREGIYTNLAELYIRTRCFRFQRGANLSYLNKKLYFVPGFDSLSASTIGQFLAGHGRGNLKDVQVCGFDSNKSINQVISPKKRPVELFY